MMSGTVLAPAVLVVYCLVASLLFAQLDVEPEWQMIALLLPLLLYLVVICVSLARSTRKLKRVWTKFGRRRSKATDCAGPLLLKPLLSKPRGWGIYATVLALLLFGAVCYLQYIIVQSAPANVREDFLRNTLPFYMVVFILNYIALVSFFLSPLGRNELEIREHGLIVGGAYFEPWQHVKWYISNEARSPRLVVETRKFGNVDYRIPAQLIDGLEDLMREHESSVD